MIQGWLKFVENTERKGKLLMYLVILVNSVNFIELMPKKLNNLINLDNTNSVYCVQLRGQNKTVTLRAISIR